MKTFSRLVVKGIENYQIFIQISIFSEMGWNIALQWLVEYQSEANEKQGHFAVWSNMFD